MDKKKINYILPLKVKYLDYDNILNIKKRVQDSGYYLIKNALL